MADKKDGMALAIQFANIIIDHVEDKHGCVVIYFTTDVDRGSRKGCRLLEKARPWLLTPSCWAHQVHL